MEHKTIYKNKTIQVALSDLPLSCPNKHSAEWKMQHPVIFLPIADAANHEIVCPYCSITYVLKDQ